MAKRESLGEKLDEEAGYRGDKITFKLKESGGLFGKDRVFSDNHGGSVTLDKDDNITKIGNLKAINGKFDEAAMWKYLNAHPEIANALDVRDAQVQTNHGTKEIDFPKKSR